METERSKIREAAETIRSHWPYRPSVGWVLGTGLGRLADGIATEKVLPYRRIPHFAAPTAISHRGRLVCGRLAGRRVVVLDGRCHRYEGHAAEQLVLPIHVLAALGAQVLILSNAAGALRTSFVCGDVMLIEDHLGLLFGPLPRQPNSFAGRSPRFDGPLYDPLLIQEAIRAAHKGGFPLRRGVYAAVSGPNYETRAEYRFLRRIGVDAVGMSSIPEAMAAHACGLRTLALSVITNVARPDSPRAVDSADVVAAAAEAGAKVRVLVQHCIRGMIASESFAAADGRSPSA